MPINVSNVVDGYIEAALWSSTDDSDDSGGEPLDANYSADDLAPRTLANARASCAQFVKANRGDIEKFKQVTGRGDDAVGHDFWLTRCGHGAGFWDRGAGAVGERLSKAAQRMGEIWVSVGDDGRIYMTGGRRRRR